MRRKESILSRIGGMRVALSLLCVYLFWGGTYLGMKYAIQTIPPFLMSAMRFSFAGWVLYAVMRLRGEKRPSWVEIRNAGAVGMLLLVMGNAVVAMAEQYVPSAIASLMIATVPLWITFLNSLIERKMPGIGPAIGIVMGLVGVGILVWNPASLSDHPVNGLAIMAILGAALCWSIGTVLSRRMRLPKAPLLTTALQMITGGAALTVVAALHGDFQGFTLAQVSPTSWIALAYLMVFGSLLGYTAYIWLFRNAEPTIAATYAYVNPIVAMFLGWLIAGEQLGVNAIVAAVIIIAAVVVITLTRDRAPASASTQMPDSPAKAAQAPESSLAQASLRGEQS